LLVEAHLLKLVEKDFPGMCSYTPEELAAKAQDILSKNAKLRSQMVSIGIPIFLGDGKKLVRGDHIEIPPVMPAAAGATAELNDEKRDHYARERWVDLRRVNMNCGSGACVAFAKKQKVRARRPAPSRTALPLTGTISRRSVKAC
jgi:hypothetical protein